MAEIEMYTKGFCPYCIAAKCLLKKKSLAFKEVPIDRNPGLRAEMIERSGGNTVPQIFINGDSIGGYSEMSSLEQSGQLDLLLATG
ncbi:MAG: glutaredoxin 3 [Xanthomonadales bacterium]|nr:glutaredoxin 3 [Xanthomonadales bacterium]